MLLKDIFDTFNKFILEGKSFLDLKMLFGNLWTMMNMNYCHQKTFTHL